MKKLAVMVSGGGSNLQAIMDGIDAGRINGRIVVVVSSKAGVYALERAEKAGIPTAVVARRDFASDEGYFNKNLEVIEASGAEGVILAGYLSILSSAVVERYKNAIINIHPALIPSFCGKGYYGHRVHQAVLDYGAKISGATVHFVDELADHGPIIMQESVPVLDDDDADALAARVLQIEHKILPASVALFCDDRLVVDGRRVKIRR